MRAAAWLVLAFYLRHQFGGTYAVPAAASSDVSQVLLGEVDVALQEQQDISEITTEDPFLKKCIVDGNAYAHSQTIPSYDPNSHCLCVGGEVYCWWQDYSTSTDSSSDDSFAFPPTSTTTARTVGVTAWTTMASASTTLAAPKVTTSGALASRMWSKTHGTGGGNYTRASEGNSKGVEDHPIEGSGESTDQQEYAEFNATYTISSSPGPVTCLVMGREYREGEVLPHSTGNCIECSCGSEGRVECSPRDCVALRPEVAAPPDIPEAPDGDFEVFNLGRDRGIDESF